MDPLLATSPESSAPDAFLLMPFPYHHSRAWPANRYSRPRQVSTALLHHQDVNELRLRRAQLLSQSNASSFHSGRGSLAHRRASDRNHTASVEPPSHGRLPCRRCFRAFRWRVDTSLQRPAVCPFLATSQRSTRPDARMQSCRLCPPTHLQ